MSFKEKQPQILDDKSWQEEFTLTNLTCSFAAMKAYRDMPAGTPPYLMLQNPINYKVMSFLRMNMDRYSKYAGIWPIMRPKSLKV